MVTVHKLGILGQFIKDDSFSFGLAKNEFMLQLQQQVEFPET